MSLIPTHIGAQSHLFDQTFVGVLRFSGVSYMTLVGVWPFFGTINLKYTFIWTRLTLACRDSWCETQKSLTITVPKLLHRPPWFQWSGYSFDFFPNVLFPSLRCVVFIPRPLLPFSILAPPLIHHLAASRVMHKWFRILIFILLSSLLLLLFLLVFFRNKQHLVSRRGCLTGDREGRGVTRRDIRIDVGVAEKTNSTKKRKEPEANIPQSNVVFTEK